MPTHPIGPADPSVRQFALAAAAMAANTRCENVRLFDLRGRSDVTSYLVIATGSSARQMRTAVDEMRDLGKSMDHKAWQTNGYEGARWIVIDFVHVVAHVFETDARDFYDLETLWGDCPEIHWREELGLPADTGRIAEERAASRFVAEEATDDTDDPDHLGADGDEDEGDESDSDADAELDAPIVTEVPDESTGSNSVSFIEIDPPAQRRGKKRASFPVTLPEAEDEDEVGGRMIEKVSLDEDGQEREAEASADGDPEAVSAEDLPDDRLASRPMGGVSASLSSTHIVNVDEQDQEASAAPVRGRRRDPDAAGEGSEDAPEPLDEDAATTPSFAKKGKKSPVKPVPAAKVKVKAVKKPVAKVTKAAAQKVAAKKMAKKVAVKAKVVAKKPVAKKVVAAKKRAQPVVKGKVKPVKKVAVKAKPKAVKPAAKRVVAKKPAKKKR